MNKRIFLALLSVVVLGAATTVYGDITGLPTKAVSDFSWIHNMSVGPDTEDLDENLTNDWVQESSQTGSISYSLEDGIQTITNDGSAGYARLVSGAWGGGSDSLFPAQIGEGDYTIEFSAKPADSETYSYQIQWLGNQTLLDREVLFVGHDAVALCTTGDVVVTLNAENNSAAFHTFRLAYDASASTAYVWRDNQYLGQGAVAGVGGAYLTAAFGGGTGSIGGSIEVDYLALDAGACAPVPEPSAIAMLVSAMIGLLAYAWRRRR